MSNILSLYSEDQINKVKGIILYWKAHNETYDKSYWKFDSIKQIRAELGLPLKDAKYLYEAVEPILHAQEPEFKLYIKALSGNWIAIQSYAEESKAVEAFFDFTRVSPVIDFKVTKTFSGQNIIQKEAGIISVLPPI